MHPDDLKVIWRCGDCSRKFVFHSDAIDHAAEFRHKLDTMKLPSGKSSRLEHFRDGEVNLDFKIEGKRVQMRISYRYYPRTREVMYLDVAYSEPALGQKIEGDSEMMRKVDLYLRASADKEAGHVARKKNS